jgi:hypothetical protein
MPGRNPLLIVKEYARAEDRQVRKNAINALAVLDDQDGWKMLTEIALEDKEPDVRSFAEAKIASLPQERAKAAVEPLLEALTTAGKENEAYAILGRLRSRGLYVKLPRLSLLSRLLNAKALFDSVYPKKGIPFRFRAWKSISLTVIISVFVLSVLASLQERSVVYGWSIFYYFLIAWFTAQIFAAMATSFTSPTRLHADPLGGALFDVVAGVAATWFAAFWAILFSLSGSGDSNTGRSVIDPILFGIAVTLAAIAVRAGTLAVFGILPSQRINWILETVVGGACGLGVFGLVILLSGRASSPLLSGTGSILPPVVFGLAASYAATDGQSPLRPWNTPWMRLPAIAFAVLATLLFSIPAIPAHRAAPMTMQGSPFSQPVNLSIPLKQVPVDITFTTEDSFYCTSRSGPHFEDKIYKADDQRKPIGSAYNMTMQPGNYLIQVNRDSSNSDEMLEVLTDMVSSLSAERLMAKLTRTVPSNADPVTTLTFALSKATYPVVKPFAELPQKKKVDTKSPNHR